MPKYLGNVCYWVSGNHLLTWSFSAFDRGCVKTRSGKGGAESFSQLTSSESSCQHKPTFTSTKSRWKFYTEVGHRSFHTPWVIRDPIEPATSLAMPATSPKAEVYSEH